MGMAETPLATWALAAVTRERPISTAFMLDNLYELYVSGTALERMQIYDRRNAAIYALRALTSS